MPEYRVHWVEKIQVWTEDAIEAESEEDAIQIAKNGGYSSIDTDSISGTETKYRAELL